LEMDMISPLINMDGWKIPFYGQKWSVDIMFWDQKLEKGELLYSYGLILVFATLKILSNWSVAFPILLGFALLFPPHSSHIRPNLFLLFILV
jgi:hypothetical protein